MGTGGPADDARGTRAPRILMLGWEFPPRISGGLGTACRGLTRALARNGAHVVFVLPRAAPGPSGTRARRVEVLSAGATRARGRVEVVPVESPLVPYASPGPTRRRRSPSASLPRAGRAVAIRRGSPAGDPYGIDLHAEVERYARAVREVARTRRFDVVHAHDWMTFPAGVAAAREARVPLVVHVHATEYDRSPHGANPDVCRVEQAGLDAADRVVTVSRFAARTILRRYRADRRKIRVVHNGIEASRARPRPLRRRGDGPVVLFLGRVTAQKGPRHFLQAAEKVARAEPRARFVVAGTGDLLAEMVERSAERGLGSRVHFTGFLGPRDVARAYRRSDVFVMPSLSEPFGIAPLEALSHGVPVVISRRSGVAEVLPSAVRVDPRDSDALARAVLDVLRKPALRRRGLARCRRELAALRWGASARRLLDVYREVLP